MAGITKKRQKNLFSLWYLNQVFQSNHDLLRKKTPNPLKNKQTNKKTEEANKRSGTTNNGGNNINTNTAATRASTCV